MSEKSENREELLRELEAENRRSTTGAVLLLQAVTRRSGMNFTDLQAMNILTSTGPIDAGRLAEMMGITTGAVTGVINRMERMGYARREKDPNDGRRVIIRPVSEKLERAAGFLGSQDRGLEELMSDYDERDLAVFLDLMRKSNDLTEEEIARIRASSESEEEGVFATALGSVESGRLVFANGATRLTLRTASGMDDLYRAHFEGPVPKVDVAGGTVTFRYPRRLSGLIEGRNRSRGDITLNAAVPWEVEVRGGAARTEADLTELELTSFVLKSGVSDLTLTLPEPSGMVPIRLSGGASKVTIRRPAGVEAHLSVKGGASKLTFDEQSFDAVGGKVHLQSPGYDAATDRYEIELSGSASELSVQ